MASTSAAIESCSSAPARTTISAQKSAPMEVSQRNLDHFMPSAPATGGANSDTPGMKRPTRNDAPPQRSKVRPVRPMQLSAESEKRHKPFRTAGPKRRPAANQ